MKTVAGILLMLILALSDCSGQVTVPSADLKPVLDSLANVRAQIAALSGQLTTTQMEQANLVGRITVLEARPQITFNGKVGDFLNGTGAWATVTVVKTGSAVFSGTTWRKAVYIPGINSTWTFNVWPHYATETPTVDYPYPILKTDSLIVIRQLNGTANLTVDYLGVLP